MKLNTKTSAVAVLVLAATIPGGSGSFTGRPLNSPGFRYHVGANALAKDFPLMNNGDSPHLNKRDFFTCYNVEVCSPYSLDWTIVGC
jgi:hypothetical protein